ncbi:serine hydrolase [Deinococcus psychrotolerans]|nr:serine hydrolase [Deinococcus psychrotolerans]
MKLPAMLLSLVVLFGGAGRADSVPVFVRIPTPPFTPESVAPKPVQPSPIFPKPAPAQPVFNPPPLSAPLAPTCGAAAANPAPAQPLPSGVSGRVGFYAAIYDKQLQPVRALALGQVNTLFPLASAFKPLVVRAALQEVDAGRLSLRALITTTPAKRSIEAYPAGRNTVAALAQRSLERSDNTASDLLYLGLGPEKIARAVHALSPCTALLHTTKAWWAAQAGLMPDVFPDLVRGAVSAASLPFDERLKWASRLNARAQQLTGPQVEAALDSYFHGPAYAPELELALQNTSTPQSYADLLARTLSGDDLKAPTRKLFRSWLAKSCCQPKQPQLKAVYWGHKAGSGWRMLTLTGYAELAGGQRIAYAYFNDGSGTLEAEDMERQIPALINWIDAALSELARSPLLK